MYPAFKACESAEEFRLQTEQVGRKMKEFRLKLLQRCEKDLPFRKSIIARCEKDFLFFVNVFGWTFRPKMADTGKSPHVPFITYQYQDDFSLQVIQAIEEGRDCAVEKSRDMGFSWMMVAIQVWGLLFREWTSLYGSYKQDYVDEKGNMDSHFERCRYFLTKLPNWMQDRVMAQNYSHISTATCSIDGDAGENFGTGGRRKFVIMDEFSLWTNDQKAFRKTSDIAPCRIFGATPEGKFNVYGKIMTNHKDYAHLGIKKIRLHWTLHPEKDEKWYEIEKNKRLAVDVAKELDISYEASVSGAVYPSFSESIRTGDFDYQAGERYGLFTSWDYGRDAVAILWILKDYQTRRNIVIDSIQKSAENYEQRFGGRLTIDFFAAFVTGKPIPGFQYTEEERLMMDRHYGWSYEQHFGDPYNGNSRQIQNQSSIAEILARHGIYLSLATKSTVPERITKVSLGLRTLDVNKARCETFVQSLTQARYPMIRESAQPTREQRLPIHDETSHFRTALEYYFDNEPQAKNAPRDYTDEELEQEMGSLMV